MGGYVFVEMVEIESTSEKVGEASLQWVERFLFLNMLCEKRTKPQHVEFQEIQNVTETAQYSRTRVL